MSTQESVVLQNQGNNGWQNIGICQIFAIEKVPFKLQSMYMILVRYSFGYMQNKTPRWTQVEWSTKLGIARTTFTDQIHKLSELNLITINTYSKYITNGGSEAFSYSPIFPHGYGKLKFKEEDEQASNGSDKQIKVTYDPNEEA